MRNMKGMVALELFGGTDDSGYSCMSGILLKDETTTKIYFPQITDNSDWWTGFIVHNPSEKSCDLTITPFSYDGTPLSPLTLTLEGQERYVGSMQGLNFPEETAWFQIEATTPISGFEVFSTLDGRQLGAYRGVDINNKKGVFAKIEKDGETGICFVNVESSWAIVTVIAYDDEGSEVAREHLDIGPYEKIVGLPSNLFSQDIGEATYIEYASDEDVVGFQLNSSSDGMMIDALPGM